MANGEAGRPTKCTPDMIEAIAKNVEAGMPFRWAAIRAGVCEKTFYLWAEKGATGEQPYASFLQRLNEAKAEAVLLGVQILRGAESNRLPGDAQPDWRAHAWLLERQFRQDFGRQTTVDANVEHSGKVDVAPVADAVRAALSGESDEALGLDD